MNAINHTSLHYTSLMNIPAIVLAAGSSSRLGRPKQLVSYLGETLLARAIRIAKDAGADPVFAVLGANYEYLILDAQNHSALPVINEHWRQGIAGSIHAGLRALDAAAPKAGGVLLLTCDQPKLTAAHLRALQQGFFAQPEPAIAASAYGGTLGTPALFPRSLFSQLLALEGDTGARALLKAPACPLVTVPLPGGELDVDTPADLDLLT